MIARVEATIRWWNQQNRVRRGLLGLSGILSAWIVFALAAGFTDRNFHAWRSDLAHYVVMTQPLEAGYWRVTGPYRRGEQQKCEGEAARLGPAAYCVVLRSDAAEALPRATPEMLEGR